MKKGWQTKKLADLVEVQNGYAFSSKDYSESGHFLMRIGNVQNGYISKADPKFIKLPDDGALQRFMLSEDDILVSLTGNVGRVGVIQKEHLPAALNQRVARINIRKDSPAKRELLLLFLYSDWFREELMGAGHGAAQQNVSTKDLVEIEIPVPPLPEQHRIVAILDEAFAGIATAKANAEKNLQNARAIFESHLQSVFTQRGEGWMETTLNRATDGIFTGPFGSLLHKSDYVANGIPLVNPAHITGIGIEPDLRKTVSNATALRLKNYIMREGDIVIGRRGEMGRCAVVTEAEDGWLCGTGSFFIKPSRRCDNRYLVRFLRSEGCKVRLEKIAGGAVMPNLSNTDLGNLAFDLPPLDRQIAIVEEIDSLHEETQRLAGLYERKLAALEALKKSLLNQAFAGKL
jgi:type I restriction enzyme, S subunit